MHASPPVLVPALLDSDYHNHYFIITIYEISHRVLCDEAHHNTATEGNAGQ